MLWLGNSLNIRIVLPLTVDSIKVTILLQFMLLSIGKCQLEVAKVVSPVCHGVIMVYLLEARHTYHLLMGQKNFLLLFIFSCWA